MTLDTIKDQTYQYKTGVYWHSGRFQNSRTMYWTWNLAICRSSRGCTYTLFLFHVVEMKLNFRSTGSGFQDTGRLSKLSYLGMKLCHRLTKDPEVAHILLNPRGSKLSLFSLYGQLFSRYGLSFKIAIFGHDTWPFSKVPEVAHTLFFYPQGVEIGLILTLLAAVSEVWADFQNCYIWVWNLDTDKRSKIAHILPFNPKGSKLSLFSLHGQRLPRYRPIFTFAKIWHETWPLAKVPEIAHTLSFYPRESKLALFSPHGQRFSRYGPIAAFGYETWPLANVPEVALIYFS